MVLGCSAVVGSLAAIGWWKKRSSENALVVVPKSASTSPLFHLFEEKMLAEGMSDAAIAAFQRNYDALVSGASTTLAETDIEPVQSVPMLVDLPEPKDQGRVSRLLKQTAVLKLNGGLGTSMGLEKAKSLLVVKDDMTFLDLIAQQIKHTRESTGANVRFILMNSFSTSDDTKEHLNKEHSDLMAEKDVELMQNKSPKVDQDMKPASYVNRDMEWCPPGHGDIYAALLGTGMLERLLADGIQYLFVSNSDNLGATLDTKLLEYFASSKKGFLMEVAERTQADKKGGHLCRSKQDKKLLLRESAQCLPADEAQFQDVQLHKYFNTNNLWINLNQLKQCLKKNNGSMPLPLIKNVKNVDPRDKTSPKVFQLETAMGAAIECFPSDKSGAVCVPRSRFAPVKTCNDLFVLRSDAYKVTEDFRVVMSRSTIPLVKLDDDFYKMVDQMEALVEKPPSLVECASLTVKGKIRFGDRVVIRGHQQLINNSENLKFLPNGTYNGGSSTL
eukprot:CAMPEP_0114282864 /NCGR_PEP_ID=MMETSP0059-20121206/3790_1 /TAXON_ID=36894 /ORGANISM="Pyramimonas parkeae, Strain CCMP726" /LENGTH=500 /DNA_ID=CAMNT_0001403543 /DNA_START=1 /DNA_END=1503 /DNA_ORIENTATION=-